MGEIGQRVYMAFLFWFSVGNSFITYYVSSMNEWAVWVDGVDNSLVNLFGILLALTVFFGPSAGIIIDAMTHCLSNVSKFLLSIDNNQSNTEIWQRRQQRLSRSRRRFYHLHECLLRHRRLHTRLIPKRVGRHCRNGDFSGASNLHVRRCRRLFTSYFSPGKIILSLNKF